MIDRDKLLKAAQSENGKLILEYLEETTKELDLNDIAEKLDVSDFLPSKLKAIAEARKIIKKVITHATSPEETQDSILNYLE